MLAEYRMRVLEYKYSQFQKRDLERRVSRKKEMAAGEQGDEIDDNQLAKELEGEQDKWEEEKSNKECLEIFNHRRASVHYLQAAI